MNLGSIITGLLGLVFGKKNWENWRMSSTEGEENYTDFGGTLDNVLAKYSGSRLTNAEMQANAFSAEQSALAFQREADFQREMFDKQTQLANTQYQRSVADMQAAGINPMMAARSSGAAIPSGGSASSSAPQSVSPGSMGNIFPSILNAILRSKEIKMQERALQADIDLKGSEAERNRVEAAKSSVQTEGLSLDNQVKRLTLDAQVESASLKNKLDRSNVRLIENKADEASASVRKMAAETSESVERAAYYEASTLLERATAYQIVELLPYEKAYKSAATQNQKDAAALAAANAAYQNHLIDDGYLDAFIRNAKAEAGSAESREELDNIKAAIRTGDYSKVHHQYGLFRDILSVFSILLDNFNPLGGLLK